MDFDKVLENRVSTRKFLDEKLSDKEIEKLLIAAKKSPIGHGYYDSLILTVITNEDLIREISEEYNKKANKTSDSLFAAKTFILFSSNKTNTCEYEDCGCVIENICLKATDMGLGSVYIRGAIHTLGKDANYVKKLNLPEGFRPISGVAIGKISEQLKGKVHEMRVDFIS